MSKSSESRQDPRDLWTLIEAKASRAVADGALHRIATESYSVEDAGVSFVVRRALRERQGASGPPTEGNPFLTPEPELFVADLTPTHFALLNKYNVLDRHLLVVTHAFVDQEERLDEADFEALLPCTQGPPVLAFYNGGVAAGASQQHKHLQVVRLPLSAGQEMPMEALMEGSTSSLAALPFKNAFSRVERRDPRVLYQLYRQMLEATNCESGPYNLLVARDWMLLVPRSRATYEGIPVNSLAFAGALFVRDHAELQAVRRIGPMAVLRGVALPKENS